MKFKVVIILKKFEIILVMIVMVVFAGIYVYIYKSISKEAIITILFIGILSLLSFRENNKDVNGVLNALKDLEI